MSALLDLLSRQLGGEALSQISRQVGADEGTTQHAIGVALPVLLGAIAHNAADPAGAASLGRALDNHDGRLLDDVAAMLDRRQRARGAGILGHVLGAKRTPVEQGLGKASGLSPQQAGRLLVVLAPIVMAALARTTREQGTPAGEIGSVLREEQREAVRRAPAAGSLMEILDSTDDASSPTLGPPRA